MTDEELITCCIFYNDAESLRQLHEICKVQLHNDMVYAACKTESSECLKYLLQNGCKIYADSMIALAVNGNLECLKCAFEYGGKWYDDIIPYLAFYGHLQAMEYAVENGCLYDKRALDWSISRGYDECYKYLLDRQNFLQTYVAT